MQNELDEAGTAKVGDVLEMPEKTISLNELDDITITSIRENNELEYSFVVSIDNDSEDTRYYDKLCYNIDNEKRMNETLYIPSPNGGKYYARFDGSSDFSRADFYEEQHYYRETLASFGIDYKDFYQIESFIK